MLLRMRPFPPGFRFGVATADHQCEAYDGHDDIRDVWERERKLTPRGRATDFWNRFREDVDLARGLGCTAFRLSLSWARLEPSAGVWDDAAFAHYRDVLQYMRDAGMATVVTLHHNTWPLHVQAMGSGAGMLDPAFPDRLAQYAKNVAERLGDLIDWYVTLNEPNQLLYGYVKLWCMRNYAVPPGLGDASSAEQMDAVLKLIPNLFLAHTHARAAIHQVRPHALVGSNPLVLGLPRWVQHWVDRAATHLKHPDDLRAQARHISQTAILDCGRVDLSIAKIEMTNERMERALFSDPYDNAYAVAVAFGSHALLDAVNAAIHGEPVSSGGTREHDRSLDAIRRRGVLRVGVHPEPADLELALAHRIAERILGDASKVAFVTLRDEDRVDVTRSWLCAFDSFRKTLSLFATMLGTNWWNLGMAGRLAPFLCPRECVGALDYVGLDYYWGVPSIRPSQLERLLSAAECRYGNAPVWPGILYSILREQTAAFPGKPIIVIENGCVTTADKIARYQYIERHLESVQRAAAEGIPVEAYLCWSITSNREWGLPFDDSSDFGLYHIDLDTDPNLTRVPTVAATRYKEIIATRRARVL